MITPHTARVDLADIEGFWEGTIVDRATYVLREALVALYRKSFDAGDEGRCYVFWTPNPMRFCVEVSFLRTQEPVDVQALCAIGWQAHELSDDDVLELFKAA